MTRAEFAEMLKGHDWYYMYSDDGRVYARGSAAEKRLEAVHKELGCPFPLGDLRMYVHEDILEKFTEYEPGKWWRGKKDKYVAPASRGELMTEEEWDNIDDWIK